MSRAGKKGFIYIMSNPSFRDGLLKIGKSSKHPDSFRKEELHTTGVPEPFVVEYSALANDFSSVETRAHKRLEKRRHKSNREFFQVSLNDAIKVVRELIGTDLAFEELSDRAQMSILGSGELVSEHPGGEIKTIKKFSSGGESYSIKEYFSNGNQKSRTNYFRGKENGFKKEWKSDGSLKKKGRMFDGLKQGEWLSYSKFGTETKYFDDGKPVLVWETFDNKGNRILTDHGPASEDYENKVYKGRPKE